jgi:GxxExxY protein
MEGSDGNESGKRQDILFATESYKIKGAGLAVYNKLGCGFLEKVYENAMVHELRKQGFTVDQQVPVKVVYDDVVVGDFFIDLLIDKKFILELKAVESENPIFAAQLINYLKATTLPLGFLVNFGMRSLFFKRIIFSKNSGNTLPIPD